MFQHVPHGVILETNFMMKQNKIPSKMYKQLVQQKVQEKVHNNYAALLINQFVFNKLVESLY